MKKLKKFSTFEELKSDRVKKSTSEEVEKRHKEMEKLLKELKKEKHLIKNCNTCGIIRGNSFYGHCAHCDSNYSGWTRPSNTRNKDATPRIN